MSLEYTNRKGNRYYVMQGTTKTGKTKYYCGRKLNADAVTELPPEFEIYEHPESAMVTIRKIKPSRLSPDEKVFLEDQVRKLANVEGFLVEATEDSLIVHASEDNREEVDHILSRLAGPFHTQDQRQWFVSRSHYHPMLRFTLTDETRRLFSLQRWCFRGGIDGWIHVGTSQCPLDELATEFLPHLGQESFYELI